MKLVVADKENRDLFLSRVKFPITTHLKVRDALSKKGEFFEYVGQKISIGDKLFTTEKPGFMKVVSLEGDKVICESMGERFNITRKEILSVFKFRI